ncbi:hypothetical protein ACP2W0_15395 [Pseudobacillus badius]|nr:hypothetical protein [Bacillus badius]MED0665017.1 hypothetical protein [Bacillus badius]UAT29152.1 hypothetical protein K7T73_11030 [Bacillus badius]GLY09687.1 hypothetical protein Bbad01_09030 [Bacillus badius]
MERIKKISARERVNMSFLKDGEGLTPFYFYIDYTAIKQDIFKEPTSET